MHVFRYNAHETREDGAKNEKGSGNEYIQGDYGQELVVGITSAFELPWLSIHQPVFEPELFESGTYTAHV
jgi:hypothetical protein